MADTINLFRTIIFGYLQYMKRECTIDDITILITDLPEVAIEGIVEDLLSVKQ